MAHQAREKGTGDEPVMAAWPPTGPSRLAEAIPRIAYGMASGMVVSLMWIVGIVADATVKAWSVVIGLSVTAVLLAGYAVLELNKLKEHVASAEARLTALRISAVRAAEAQRTDGSASQVTAQLGSPPTSGLTGRTRGSHLR